MLLNKHVCGLKCMQISISKEYADSFYCYYHAFRYFNLRIKKREPCNN